MAASTHPVVELDPGTPLWERVHIVAPLVLVGTVEPDGRYDLAPKHMAMPLGWQNYFGFVCTPRHSTYTNVRRERGFTVNFPTAEQVVQASLTATPRCADGSKPAASVLPVTPATRVAGPLVTGAYLQLECELDRIVEGFGENGLVVGRVLAARADPAALIDAERDPNDTLAAAAPIAYLHPGRFVAIRDALSFPYPEHMRK